MRIDTGIAHSANDSTVLPIEIFKFLGQTNISHVDNVPSLAVAHEEIIRFDISVDVIFGMDVSKARDQLVREHQDRLQRKLPAAVVDEISQIWTEEFKGHHSELAFRPVPVHFRDPRRTMEDLINFDFVFKMGGMDLDILELQSDLLSSFKVMAYF